MEPSWSVCSVKTSDCGFEIFFWFVSDFPIFLFDSTVTAQRACSFAENSSAPNEGNRKNCGEAHAAKSLLPKTYVKHAVKIATLVIASLQRSFLNSIKFIESSSDELH